MDMGKVAKAGLGIIIVIVLFVIVMNWWGDYRAATAAKAEPGSTVTSSTTSGGTTNSDTSGSSQASAASDARTSPTVLVVSVDGLNFRQAPDGQSKTLRGLSKGDRLTVLGTEGGWYKVEDSKGVIGYITSNASYTSPAD
jgi:uncharacterized protein YgiM (DUF1202 family)